MSKYPTEQALINLVNDLADDLKKIERGNPAHIPATARLIQARKALALHRKGIKAGEDKAR